MTTDGDLSGTGPPRGEPLPGGESAAPDRDDLSAAVASALERLARGSTFDRSDVAARAEADDPAPVGAPPDPADRPAGPVGGLPSGPAVDAGTGPPVPGQRRGPDPEWLTFVPASTEIRSVPAGTGAEVLPRGGSVARRRVRTALAVAAVVAASAGGAVVATGAGGRLADRARSLAGTVTTATATPTGIAAPGAGRSPSLPSSLPTPLPSAPVVGVVPETGPGVALPTGSPTPTTGPGMTADATVTVQEAAALRSLHAQRTADLAGLALDGRWVALLASKYPGVSDPYQTDTRGSHVFDAAAILAQHLQLRRGPTLATRVVLLLSTDYGQRLRVDGRPLWVTVALGGFPSADAVQSWCAARFSGLGAAALADACTPRRLDTPVPLD
jgi:hypothetical protein